MRLWLRFVELHMRKLLFAMVALALVAPATSALAADRYSDSDSYRYGYQREHRQDHREYKREHRNAHRDGFDSRRDHRSYHRELREDHRDDHRDARRDDRRGDDRYGYTPYQDGYRDRGADWFYDRRR